MNNPLKINILITIGTVLVVIAGIASYYLHNICSNIADTRLSNGAKIINNQKFEYMCMRFYISNDGRIDGLNKLFQDGWHIYSLVGNVEKSDASRVAEIERYISKYIYVVMRRPY